MLFWIIIVAPIAFLKFCPPLTLTWSCLTVRSVLSNFVWFNRILLVVTILSAVLVFWICVVTFCLNLLKSPKMKRPKINPYLFSSVTFPDPWVAIQRPGVRLCIDEPVEIITAVSRQCITVYTLSIDSDLTDFVKSYAHYFHTIEGCNGRDVVVSYLSLPRFVVAMRDNLLFRSLVLSAPVSVFKGRTS